MPYWNILQYELKEMKRQKYFFNKTWYVNLVALSYWKIYWTLSLVLQDVEVNLEM